MTPSGDDLTVLRPMRHGLRAMTGRDPYDTHRAATPLELLYDLVFVISFGVAGSEFAHLVAEGYWQEGLSAFAFAMFAVIWTWINFTWFASAYDTDDWIYRVLVTVQMIGVVILALGLPAMFDSVHHHEPVARNAMVAGYVVMRVPLLFLWLRAAKESPGRAKPARIYASTILVSQVLWTLSLLIDVKMAPAMLVALPIFVIEFVGPILAERTDGGTPWHPHHIAERYGLLAIISLGEILIGTVAALESLVELDGWTLDLILIAVFGVALTVGLWWIYFSFPAGEVLAVRRSRAFGWGYGHLVLYSTIAAVGAGLHVAALYLEHHAAISATAVMLSIAIPMSIFQLAVALMSASLLDSPVGGWLRVVVYPAITMIAVVAVQAGLSIPWGIGILVLSTVAYVVDLENGLGDDGQSAIEEWTLEQGGDAISADR